jgi:uncharacterized protein YcaQ
VIRSGSPAPRARLSPDDARRITLHAQGFLGAAARRGGVAGLLRRLGAVQLDTISVLARSHELVAYARLGAIPRQRIEQAYWHPGLPTAFEYWAHAACLIPVEEWPYYAFRRRALRAAGQRWHAISQRACAEVLARLRADGPLTASQLGGAKRGKAWWDWSEAKIAVEWLLDLGEVVCVRRQGWRRVYDLPERVLPPGLLGGDRSDGECLARLARVAARALGVATRADLVDYHRLRSFAGGSAGHADLVDDAAQAAGLVPVVIDGGERQPVPAWADPGALSAARSGLRGRHRVALLSPFDSLVWDRRRTRRMFGFEHSLEAYLPREKRVHGYYAMPLLAGGRLAGRADPARRGQTLAARQVSLAGPAAARPMATALREAAEWVGCSAVTVDRVSPPQLSGALKAALAEAGC